MKAMILAAGEGTRLQPLTDELPKPLLPVANLPQIEYLLELLREAGVRDVIINLHYLGEKIRDAIGTTFRNEVAISYSEEPEILGTGGGLKRVRDFFDDEPFILVNADTILEIEIEDIVQYHREKNAIATMVVRDWMPHRRFGRVEINEEGRIVRILNRGMPGAGWPVVFTGFQLLSPRIFAFMPDSAYSCLNRDCHGRMLEAGGRIYGFRASGYWREIGSLIDYFRANMDFIRGLMPPYCGHLLEAEEIRAGANEIYGARVIQPVLIAPGCRVGRGSRLGPGVILGEECTVGEGARLERVVALPGSSFAENERIRGAIRSPWATVVMDEEV